MSPPVTVLHVITRLELGGAQHNTLYTVAHLDRSRFRPALAWGPGDRLDALAETLEDVELHPVPSLVRAVEPRADRAALAALRRIIGELRPAVVHTHSSKAGVVGRLAARLERVPVVVHSIHGFGFTPLQSAPVRALFLAAERLAARWTDHFIAVSSRNAAAGVELGLFPLERVTVIRSGVALAACRAGADAAAAVRLRLALPATAPLVVQVANFKPQKAPLDFVRMAAEVARRVPAARFVMAGDGPLRGAAESLAMRLKIADRMCFAGWVDDPAALYAASRVAVLTSRHEGLPRAVVEALAAGVPVVAAAVDGTVEVVRDGTNGYLVEAGDVAGFAARVTAVLEDDALACRLAAAAPEHLEDFDIDRMVRRQEELYAWLLGPRA